MNDHEHCGCGHDHAHGEACGCGHDHAHGEACGCGHDHAHGEACGCGHAHAHDHVDIAPVEDLSVLQPNFLLALYERKYLPVARFALRSSREDSIYAEALAPVYLGSPEDSMEQAKAWGAELSALAQGGLITLDYDMPLTGYAYQEYENAELYRYFQQTVREGSQTPGALFDTAALETGSMALTEAGRARVLEMLNEVE